jgi:two-component system, OmpR family, response regulator
MDNCPRCGAQAVVVGYEDARTYYQCENCKRVWTTEVTAPPVAKAAQPPLRVLVADDSDELAGLLAMWLEDEGYSVVTATSGRRALDVAALHRPEIAIIDVVMPPPDGFEVCEALQARPEAPEVILMTGILDPVRLERAGDLHVAELLRKPFTQEVVIAAVAAVAKRYRAAHRSRPGA